MAIVLVDEAGTCTVSFQIRGAALFDDAAIALDDDENAKLTFRRSVAMPRGRNSIKSDANYKRDWKAEGNRPRDVRCFAPRLALQCSAALHVEPSRPASTAPTNRSQL